MAIEDQLSEGEQVVLRLHPHWKTLLRPTLILVVVVAAALALLIVIPAGRVAGPSRIAVGALALVLAWGWFVVPLCAGRPRATSSPRAG